MEDWEIIKQYQDRIYTFDCRDENLIWRPFEYSKLLQDELIEILVESARYFHKRLTNK